MSVRSMIPVHAFIHKDVRYVAKKVYFASSVLVKLRKGLFRLDSTAPFYSSPKVHANDGGDNPVDTGDTDDPGYYYTFTKYEPQGFGEFRGRLDTMTEPKTPKKYGYDKPLQMVLHDMLPAEVPSATGRIRTTDTQGIAIVAMLRQMREWLREEFEPTKSDELWFTMLMEAKIFYDEHCVDETPVTNRLRCLWFQNDHYVNHRQQADILKEVWKDAILKPHHKQAKRANDVLYSLKTAPSTSALIDREHFKTTNVVAVNHKRVLDTSAHFSPLTLMDGTIFMTEDFLVNSTDDILAFALSHEMFHVVAKHTAEVNTYRHFFWSILLHFSHRLRCLYPGDVEDAGNLLMITAICTRQWFPHKHVIELEADEVGFRIMTEAGFEPSESLRFFKADQLQVDRDLDFSGTHLFRRRTKMQVDLPVFSSADATWVRLTNKVIRDEMWGSEHPPHAVRLHKLKQLVDKSTGA